MSGADALLRSRGAEAQDAEELSAGDDRQGDSYPAVKRVREEHARIAVPCGRLELLARLIHPLLGGPLEGQRSTLQGLGAGPGLACESQRATVVSGHEQIHRTHMAVLARSRQCPLHDLTVLETLGDGL